MKDDLTYLLKQIQYKTMTGENRTHTQIKTGASQSHVSEIENENIRIKQGETRHVF